MVQHGSCPLLQNQLCDFKRQTGDWVMFGAESRISNPNNILSNILPLRLFKTSVLRLEFIPNFSTYFMVWIKVIVVCDVKSEVWYLKSWNKILTSQLHYNLTLSVRLKNKNLNLNITLTPRWMIQSTKYIQFTDAIFKVVHFQEFLILWLY